MADDAEPADAVPWYRQRWPWLLMLPPAAAVVGCAITIVLALRSADGVVAADYYKRGLAINEELARAQQAARLGLRARIDARGVADGDEVRLRVEAERAPEPAAALRLRLVHPGRDGADREALLARIGVAEEGRVAEYAGRWQTALPLEGRVNWRVALEAPTWRLDGDAAAIDRGPVLITAAPAATR